MRLLSNKSQQGKDWHLILILILILIIIIILILILFHFIIFFIILEMGNYPRCTGTVRVGRDTVEISMLSFLLFFFIN